MKFTQKLAETVCDLIADGMSLPEICAGEGMPSYSAVMRWLRQDEAFREEYAQAKQAQAQKHFDELADLERSCLEGSLEPSVFRAVLDSRKWRLARALPVDSKDMAEPEHDGLSVAELLNQRLNGVVNEG